jgi:hypothetical protein
MKSTTPHDPLDELIAAALHGELTPEERTALDARLQHDAAARAAYQESQFMHDLIERTHREAQPDPAFEQRMVSGVRRKIQHEAQHRETAWESVVVLWRALAGLLPGGKLARYATVAVMVLVLFWMVPTSIVSTFRSGKGHLFGELADKKREASSDDFAMPYKPAASDSVKALKDVFSAKSMVMNADRPQQFGGGSAVQDQTRQVQAGSTLANMNAPPAMAVAAPPSAPPADFNTLRSPVAGVVKAGDGAGTVTATGFADNGTSVDRSAAASNLVSVLPVEQAAQSLVEPSAAAPTPIDTRKLIRNAQLDLEVKDYQAAVDKIAALTKDAGGYVDTSNSQRGGNGKLQGTVVVKILPEKLDAFLLKLRDLGELKNQALSTEDVTKEYYDTQARLNNSQRMEAQLQDLLKHTNGKVSELLQVERELGRVRGDIEQMQGELKLYDFQVQYATVTISVAEKDLTQAAAYLLKESDQFSLFTTDVEGAFGQARRAADDFKAHILTANLNHNSGSDVSATMSVSVPPEQIEGFLAQVRSLGRVQNFTRQTERVARDGGDTDQPADETRTEKDHVLVQLTIQSDNQSQKEVALTVVTPAVDQALDQAKAAALASNGAEILSSSLSKTPDGPTTAQISVRVPGKNYAALLGAFRALGRTSTFSLQRDDNTGPNVSGDDTPATISLALTDDEAPVQQTELVVRSTDIDAKAQQLKKDAAAAGAEVKASGFERQPDGMETAQMTFQMPLSQYGAFLEKLKSLGQVDTLTVHREDRPGQGADAPAEISLRLYSEGQIVADDNGVWANLRRTFGEGAQALFDSVRMIGVMIAFLLPWVAVLAFAAWVARRVYVARKK